MPKKRVAYEDMGERLRRARTIRGYRTRREFATAIEIPENKYARYERGESRPKPELERLICEKLGVSPEELWWGRRPDHGRAPIRDLAHVAIADVRAGMAEDGPDVPLSASGSATVQVGSSTARHGTPPPALPTATAPARAAWQLARCLVRNRTRLAARTPEPGRTLQDTAKLSTQLVAEPLAVIEREVQSMKFEQLPSGEADKISHKIETFLASLGEAA